LPKGTPEPGETREATALREVAEETGLQVRITAPFDSIEYWFVQSGQRIHKTVHYYLMEAVGGDLRLHDHEFDEVRWVRTEDAPTIMTPHEGELARLLGVESSAVQARRLEHARAAAEQSQAIVVLKGDDTLVAQPGGLVAVSPGATGALATAGTGDVLSGVLAAVLARDVDPFMAACAGVRLHARAGIHAAHEKGVDGVIARDVIEALPFAR